MSRTSDINCTAVTSIEGLQCPDRSSARPKCTQSQRRAYGFLLSFLRSIDAGIDILCPVKEEKKTRSEKKEDDLL